MFDLREEQERVILVGVQENGGANAEESLDELAELASTARCEGGGPPSAGARGHSSGNVHRKRKIRGIENSGARLRCDGASSATMSSPRSS